MASQEEDDVKSRLLALGRQLAAWRGTAQETQRSLADQLPFSRSTVANVEVGRQGAPREFWQRCDDLLGARGDLLASYDQLAAVIDRRAHADLQRAHAQLTSGRPDRPSAACLSRLPKSWLDVRRYTAAL